MSETTIGVLHPGEMGTAIAAQIVRTGHPVVWCADGRSDATAARAEAAGLQRVDGLARLLERCQIVLSICPPAAAEDVATAVAETGYAGVYVDANAISPQRMRRIDELVTGRGATVVDGSIIGPAPNDRRTARVYLAGPPEQTARVAALLAGSPAEPIELGQTIGRASALKMAYASFTKGSRVLAAVAHALADDHDVTGALLAEGQRLPGDVLTNRDAMPGIAARAWRWAPEFGEIADTLTAQDLPPELALAAESVLDAWNRALDGDGGATDVIGRLRRARTGPS